MLEETQRFKQFLRSNAAVVFQLMEDLQFVGLDEAEKAVIAAACNNKSMEKKFKSISYDLIYMQLFFVVFGFTYSKMRNPGNLAVCMGKHQGFLWQFLADKKERYSMSDLMSIWCKTTCIGNVLENRNFGRSLVTVQAWREFCEMIDNPAGNYEQLKKMFIEYFGYARLVNLHGGPAVYRLINDHYHQVEYLEYQSEQIRFVVQSRAVESVEIGSIIAVERIK